MENLDNKGEEQWGRLREQVHLSDGFWLGFVFSSSPPAVALLRERMLAELKTQHRSMVVRTPAAPDELRSVLPWLLTDLELIAAGCVWIESIVSDAPGAPGSPWLSAWDQLFLRMNEHRDALRTRLHGGLVLAATSEVKPKVRDAAPDLWSVRSLVVEDIRLAAEPAPLRRTRTEWRLDRPTGAAKSPDPAFALAEARRREESSRLSSTPTTASRGHALLDAAEGFLAEGQPGEALSSATEAREILRGKDMLGETRALWILARAALARGDLAAAGEHAERAVAVRGTYAPSDVPVEWYDLAGRLALSRADRAVAATMYNTAMRSALQRLKGKETFDVLEDLLVVLIGLGDLRQAEGNVDRAMVAFERAVAVARRLASIRPNLHKSMTLLSFVLLKWGDARGEQGDISGAIAAFEEARRADDRLHALVGDTPEALRLMSVTFNRIGNARRDAGDVAGAAREYEQALTLRRGLMAMVGESPQTLRAVSSSLLKIGELRSEQGDSLAAAAAFDEALGIDRKVRASVGDSPESLRDLAVSLYKNGEVRQQMGEHELSKSMFLECVAVAEALQGVSDQPQRDQPIMDAARRALVQMEPGRNLHIRRVPTHTRR